MSYRLLLLSPIPVHGGPGAYESLDLWVRDLRGQVAAVDFLTLIASRRGPCIDNETRIPEGIRVCDRDALSAAELDRLVREHDVIQVGLEPGLFNSIGLRVAKAAVNAGRCLVLGISSNRAATIRLNAAQKSWPRRLKARMVADRLIRNVRVVAEAADGVFLTGHGLRDMLGSIGANVHVGIASWITQADMLAEDELEQKLAREGPVRLCAAARLEPMKGIHLAVEALHMLRDLEPERAQEVRLEILGEGEQKHELTRLVEQYNLKGAVHFGGTRTYPEAFFETIRSHDLMLITNLNVEQPRIIFDAISQGLVPICPDSAPYVDLGIDSRVLYERGDADSLARALQRMMSPKARREIMPVLCEFARRHTLESMHETRASWIEELLALRSQIHAETTPPPRFAA